MEITKVMIENWPNSNILIEYMPILIAVIAIAVSLYSVYLTRKSFVATHRPYVWASSYAFIDTTNNSLVQLPFKVAYRVKNSPARIIRSEVKINLNKEEIFIHKSENLVRFPDERSEWGFSISEIEFNKILYKFNSDKSDLFRILTLEYSSLDGEKVYHYKLEQSFSSSEKQWKDTNETGD